MSLRAEFPMLERLAYLNAGTDGPVPRRAVEAVAAEVARQADEGRMSAYFERRALLKWRQAEAYGRVLGRPAEEVSLTTSTTEGIALVLNGYELGSGDELLTSDQEHPGVLGPLAALRRRRGVRVRVAPFASIDAAVGPDTRLVVCSHVSWVSGELAPGGLAEVEPPVVLDGAQGAGAVPVDVEALGCAAYAAAGQKWLCGPDGTGLLWIDPAFRERVSPLVASYWNIADPPTALESDLWGDARRYDSAAVSGEASAFALASLELLERAGWKWVWERAASLAEQLADGLLAAGRVVAPRDRTTLVSWESSDAEAERAALATAGVLVRDIPGRGLLRASVGAWNDERDLDRLLAALPARD